jgi:hypothetical protein
MSTDPVVSVLEELAYFPGLGTLVELFGNDS